MNNEKHLDIYDWIRLIATLYVVIGHSAYLAIGTVYGGVIYELPLQLNDAYNSIFLVFLRNLPRCISVFHMPLFFMLSGAVLAIKPIKSFDNVCVSKLKRLVFPYIIYGCLFMIPVKCLADFYSKSNLPNVYSSFLIGGEGGHLWFLPALFWCILVFVILLKILKRFNINSIYALLALTGIIQLLCLKIPFDIFGLQKGLYYIFWFSLGYVFEIERSHYKLWNMKKIVFAFLVVFSLEIICFNKAFLNSFYLTILGAFFTYLLARIFEKIFKKFTNTKAWKVLIRNLFNIYLFHDPLEYVILKIYMGGKYNYLSTSFGCYSYTFLRIVGVIIISIILGEMISFIKKLFIKFMNSNDLLLSKLNAE